jgi:hypothetical protein
LLITFAFEPSFCDIVYVIYVGIFVNSKVVNEKFVSGISICRTLTVELKESDSANCGCADVSESELDKAYEPSYVEKRSIQHGPATCIEFVLLFSAKKGYEFQDALRQGTNIAMQACTTMCRSPIHENKELNRKVIL